METDGKDKKVRKTDVEKVKLDQETDNIQQLQSR